ncbi:uncharacterized protein MKZ38_001996 [Zalerion maritima]|uniref:ASCH domain-containing protein n=1 Tax=Zalerion maritima TaxID=339359 RepID=A0AAD5RWW4_9PEZI|nr:uncharacterized protein MKZ38_001996 [Zalerion maritima]
MASPSSVPQDVPREDIFISIHPEHVQSIAARTKNHEYRNYLLPSTISRLWVYTTAPVSSVEFIAEISTGKTPGQFPEDGGIGNSDFNRGTDLLGYGYEILSLWRLKQPITLSQLQAKKYLKGPPQKYCYVKRKVRDDYLTKSRSWFLVRRKLIPNHKQKSRRYTAN